MQFVHAPKQLVHEFLYAELCKEKGCSSAFGYEKKWHPCFGTPKSKKILEKMGGWINYNNEEGVFTSEFLVPAI